MRLFFDGLDLVLEPDDIREEKVEKSVDLVFDDEPLEQILYGKDLNGPTRANLYLPALEYVRRIRRAYLDGNIQDALEMASELVMKRYPISKKMCFELAVIMREIIPNYPNPVIEFDLLPLGALLEQMWTLALKTKDKELQDTVGTPLYRWYEHHYQYQNARRVLTTLIEIYREEGNQTHEAVLINNFAFEFLLEGEWEAAIPHFVRSVEIFKENNDTFEYANARANYWTCRFELDDLKEVAKVEKEVKSLAKTLRKSEAWHSRKPLILLAKIVERRGNINKAIRFVERAIKLCEKGNTRYPELDAKYLEHLKKQVVYDNNI